MFGQDLRSSAVQLGKALEDPVQGITALRRVEVSFSASQRELIGTLVETGQVAEAQRLILDALERQVGGAGTAKASGLTGATNRLADAAWRDDRTCRERAACGAVNGLLHRVRGGPWWEGRGLPKYDRRAGQITPKARMASATRTKPVMFAPST